LVDDSSFAAANTNNFVWTSFTRSNPSHDVHGVGAFVSHKHWGCKGPLVLDARKKPHHAPELIPDPKMQERAARILDQSGFRK
jgi:4-hydroxy-3-polyprenylbenzoate decarboxylase